MKNEIKLVQSPVITHKIQEVGKQISERIKALNIDNLIASEDSLQALKTLRTDLNKELNDYEAQRKEVKKAVAQPYMDMEAIYKVEISTKISDAVTKLKDKISFVENKLKDEKKKNLEIYFTELCTDQAIDFLKFDDLKLNINLTVTEKKLKEQANEFVLKVSDDLLLIESQEHNVEILVEYKKTLNSSKAITDILARKEAVKQAQIAAEQKEWDRRKAELRNLAMVQNTVTKTFDYNENIFVKESEVKDCSKDELIAIVQELRGKIKAHLESIKPKVEPVSAPITKPAQATKPAPAIKKPVEQLPVEEIETSDFRVKTTMAKLRLLAAFLDENQIEYESL